MNWIIKTLLGYYMKKAVTLDFLGGYKVYIILLGGIVVTVIGMLGGANLWLVTIPPLTVNAGIDLIWKIIAGMAFRKAIPKKGGEAVVTNVDLNAIKQIDRVNPNVRPPRPDGVGNSLVTG